MHRPESSSGRRTEAAAPALMVLLAAASLAVGAPAAGATAPASASAAAARTRIVTIEGMQFHPQSLVVRRGERIKWINKDLFPHTVTAAGGAFDSHAIGPDGSWTYVARKAGEYDYSCSFHPTMKGKLIVR